VDGLCHLIAVTFGEFQSWFRYGQIRLNANRIVVLERDEGGAPRRDGAYVGILLEQLPFLSHEDEEGVVVVEVVPAGGFGRGEERAVSPFTVSFDMADVTRVIPLTETAGRIIGARVSDLGVSVAPAFFEKEVRKAFRDRMVGGALRAGDALAEVFFEDVTATIGEDLRLAVRDAVVSISGAMDKMVGQQEQDLGGNSWVRDAFSFTRHDPHDLGSASYLHDAGVVLSKVVTRRRESSAALDAYREAWQYVRERKEILKGAGLEELLADPVLRTAAAETEKRLQDAFPAGLTSLVLFLRWKERFHKRREVVDFEELAVEIPQFSRAIGFSACAASVWLLGAFIGHEHLVPAIYQANAKRYRWFSGPPVMVTKVRKSPEDGGARGAVRDLGAVGKEVALADAAEEVETPVAGVDTPESETSGGTIGESASDGTRSEDDVRQAGVMPEAAAVADSALDTESPAGEDGNAPAVPAVDDSQPAIAGLGEESALRAKGRGRGGKSAAGKLRKADTKERQQQAAVPCAAGDLVDQASIPLPGVPTGTTGGVDRAMAGGGTTEAPPVDELP
jgi:hypothetical protein